MKVALVVCLVSATAFADEAPTAEKPALTKLDTSRIEALYNEGTKHYDLGEWDAAIASFRQAYALMPDPSFLYNIAQAYRQKDACRDATAAYKAYLRNAPDEDRAKVEKFIKELESCVKLEEENARRLLPPPPPPPPVRAGPRLMKWSGVVTAGVGVAAVATAVVFSFRARGAEHDLEDRCGAGCNGSEIEALDRKGRDSDRIAKVMYIAGGSLFAAGSAMAVYALTRSERVTVQPTPAGAMVTWGGRF